MSSYKAFDSSLGRLAAQLDEVRQVLFYAHARAQQAAGVTAARQSRAVAYVLIAAALESFVAAVYDALCDEINRARVACADVCLGIVALEQASRFDSIAASRKQGIWGDRAAVVQRSGSDDIVELNPKHRPLDGRTIKIDHLDTLWTMFEVPGTPVPRPQLRLALVDLSDGRNEVAHGNVTPALFGRRKPLKDVLGRVDHVEELGIHIAESLDDYVRARGFERLARVGGSRASMASGGAPAVANRALLRRT